MIAMTHQLHKRGDGTGKEGLFVYAASDCSGNHHWTVEITNQDRLEGATKPKHWYRLAENVLLSLGKLRLMKVGKWATLFCKECPRDESL